MGISMTAVPFIYKFIYRGDITIENTMELNNLQCANEHGNQFCKIFKI